MKQFLWIVLIAVWFFAFGWYARGQSEKPNYTVAIKFLFDKDMPGIIFDSIYGDPYKVCADFIVEKDLRVGHCRCEVARKVKREPAVLDLDNPPVGEEL